MTCSLLAHQGESYEAFFCNRHAAIPNKLLIQAWISDGGPRSLKAEAIIKPLSNLTGPSHVSYLRRPSSMSAARFANSEKRASTAHPSRDHSLNPTMKPRIFRTISMAAILLSSMMMAHAEDSQLLMYAAKVNAGHRIAKECSGFAPGFLADYEKALQVILVALKPRGLTDEVKDKAEATPELSSNQYLKKFQSLSTEAQLKWCITTLLDVHRDAANVKDLEQ